MTLLSIQIPDLVQPDASARNGFFPDASFYAQATAALNHSLAFRHREVFRRDWDLGTITRSSGANVIARWRFRSGYGATRLRLQGIMGGAATAATDPFIDIAITKSGGATTTKTFRFGLAAVAPTDAPSEWSVFTDDVDIDPASVYECNLETNNYAFAVSLCVFELGPAAIDESISYFSAHTPQGGGPIFDANQQKLIEGPANMHRQNGGLVAHWGLYNGAARTRTSATLANIVDNTSTGNPTTTTPGYRFNTQYRNTASRTTVPVELAVWGSNATSTGTVQLVNTSGTAAVTVTINSATPQWFTATGSIAAGTGQKYDLQFNSAGGSTTSVIATSLTEYEA